MKLSRILCLFLCLAMVATVCGCGSKATTSEYTVYEEEFYFEDQELLEELETETTSEKKSTVTAQEPGKKLFDEPVTFTVFAMEHPYQTYTTNTLKFKELQEATNVTLKIDVTSQSNFTAKQAAILASGQLYDINVLNFNTLSNYSPDLFVDLSSYIKSGKLPNYTKWYNQLELASWIQVDGKIPGFIQVNAGTYPNTADKTSTNGGIYPVIRKDILASNNLKIPTNYDDWYTTMKTLKAKYPDSTPIGGRHKKTLVQYLEQSLCCYHGFYYDYDSKTYKLGILESQYRDVLSFMIKCYNEGIIGKNFESSSSSTWEEGVAKNKIFFWIDNVSFADYQTTTLQKSNPKADMSVMPLMTGLFGKKIGYAYADSWYETTYCLNAKSDKVDKLLTFMDWCYTDSAMYINSYGKENVTFTVNDNGTVNIPEKLADRYKNKTYPYYSYAADFGLGQLSFTPLVRNTGELTDVITGKKDTTLYDTLKSDFNAGNIKTQIAIKPVVQSAKRSTISSKAEAIENLMENNIYDFITGRKSISELDSLISQIKSLGAQEVLDAYTAATK